MGALHHQIANDNVVLSIAQETRRGDRLPCGHYIGDTDESGQCLTCIQKDVAKERKQKRKALPFYLR